MSSSLPPGIRDQLTNPASAEVAVDAMKGYIASGDAEAFQQAVAIYCAGARDRGERIEQVLSVLKRLAAKVGGPTMRNWEIQVRPTEMHELILAGILRAFYGDNTVDREAEATAERKSDAAGHAEEGTWPKPST